ncbi:hypothetical protein HK096_011202 [Nowakowskiella sp. JEL0078]|nr:hypothetical protein HK096_011202 [Nowakowskiella sp. JEL0078]
MRHKNCDQEQLTVSGEPDIFDEMAATERLLLLMGCALSFNFIVVISLLITAAVVSNNSNSIQTLGAFVPFASRIVTVIYITYLFTIVKIVKADKSSVRKLPVDPVKTTVDELSDEDVRQAFWPGKRQQEDFNQNSIASDYVMAYNSQLYNNTITCPPVYFGQDPESFTNANFGVDVPIDPRFVQLPNQRILRPPQLNQVEQTMYTKF